MSVRPRLALPAAVALLALALTGCGGGGAAKAKAGGKASGGGSAAGQAGPARTEAADLRANLSALLRGDANLTALAAQTAKANGFESEQTRAAINVMHQSANALTNEIAIGFSTSTEDFGRNEIQRLRLHLNEYVGYIADYINAAMAAKETLKAEAQTQLEEVEEDLAADIADVTGKIVPVSDAEGLLGEHTGLLTTTIDAIAEDDPAAPDNVVETATAAQEMAKDVSRALVLAPNEQLAFGGTEGGGRSRISGDAISASSTLRADLTGYLVQHVAQSLVMAHLAAETGADSEQTKAAIETLHTNAEQLSAVIEDVYGRAAADDFTRLFDEHVTALVDFAGSAAAEKGATTTPASTDFPARFAALAGRLTDGQVNEREFEAALSEQVDAMQAAIEAIAKGSPSAASKAEEAQAKARTPAKLLAEGIAEQFPHRYPAG